MNTLAHTAGGAATSPPSQEGSQVRRPPLTFTPSNHWHFAFETLGPLSPSTTVFLTELGCRLAASTGGTARDCLSFSSFVCRCSKVQRYSDPRNDTNLRFIRQLTGPLALSSFFYQFLNFVFSRGIVTPKGNKKNRKKH